MNFGTTFVAHAQSSELVQPTVGALDDPAINSQTAAVRNPAFGQKRLDPAPPQRLPMRFRVVRAVGIGTVRAALGGPTFAGDWRNGVDHRQQLGDVVRIGRRDFGCQRDSVSIGDDVVFRAGFAAIRGIRAGLVPPKTARTDVESIADRDQSIWSAARKRDNTARWILFHTPCCCHAANRRQQVIPLPQPSSCGKSSQAMPVFSTNKMPVSTARSSSGLRPGYRLRRRFGGGKSGSIISHNSSSKIGCAMSVPPCTARNSKPNS